MKHIEYYVANDGKRFDNEFDCLEHEMNIGFENNHSIVGMTFFEEVMTTPKDLCDADIIAIKDTNGELFIKEIEHFFGYEMPHEIGVWHWNDANSEWEHLDAVKEEYYHYKELVEKMTSLL